MHIQRPIKCIKDFMSPKLILIALISFFLAHNSPIARVKLKIRKVAQNLILLLSN